MTDTRARAPAPSGGAPQLVASGGRSWAVIRMLGNEITKNLLILWHRRAIFLMELTMMAGFYLSFQYLIGGGQLVDELLAMTLPGLLAYSIAYLLLLKVVAGIIEERNTGTLEQMHLSPLSPWLLSVGLLSAVVLEAVLVAAIVGGGLIIALDLPLPGLTWATLLPAVLILLDLAGFALLMGGIALTITSIGSVNHVIQSSIGLLNGAIIPVYVYPDWLQMVATFVPSMLGVDVLRKLLIENRSLLSTWSDHSLQWAMLHTAAMLLLGWAVYQRQIRRTLREGRLGPQ